MLASVVAAVVVSSNLGCGATRPGPGAAGPTANGSNFEQSFQADAAPVRALVVSDSFLWIGSERGLRRARLPGAAEWIGPAAGIAGRRVSALAVDRQGRVLVATEAAVGRLVEVDGQPRYQLVATLPGATHLGAVTAEGGGDGIWAGTAKGLFFLEGGAAAPVAGVAGGEVTSLDLDADGKSVWASVRGKGLFHVNATKVIARFGADSADPLDLVDVLGTAVLANGTRIAVGRGAKGGTRVVLLRMDGPELLQAQPDVPVVALIPRPRGPLLVVGPAAAPRLFALALAERGEMVEGGFRFTPARKTLQGIRLVARPDPRPLPPDITIVALGGAGGAEGGSLAGKVGGGLDGVFLGTRAAGVARLAVGKSGASGVPVPDYLPVGELAMDARGLSVACLEQERCVVSTGAGPGWIWDGRDRTVKPIPEGAVGGSLMALAGDGAGTVYFVAGDGGKTLAIARLSSDGARWEPLLSLPVAVEGSAVVTFATLSPQGNLWLAVRDRAPSGQEFGRGVIEVQLPAGRAIHHRPYREKEDRPAEAIPIVGDVAAIRFAKGSGADPDAIWFCTSVGIMRFVGGDLARWGENEGLDSEHCHDLAIATDGTVWVATEEGPARFDGKRWLRLQGAGSTNPVAGTTRIPSVPASAATPAPSWPVDREGESIAARALVGFGRDLWAGTPRGVWPLTSVGRPIDRASGLVDDDVVDLVVDRFGRLWVLGHIGLTIRPMPR